MPTPPKPPVKSVAQFRLDTSPPIARKSLDYIDNRLGFFHDHTGNGHASNVSHLRDVLTYVEAYRTAKRTKYQANTSKNLAKRWGMVDELEKQIFKRLQWESYMMQKTGGARAAAAAMPGAYDLERQHFLDLKQQQKAGEKKGLKGLFSSAQEVDTNPYSVSTGKDYAAQQAKKTGQDTDWDTMTLANFTQMMNSGTKFPADPRVYFVRLTERIDRYLLVCIDGLWYQSAKLVNGFFMYALDKYGNLLAGPVNKRGTYADGSRLALVKGVRCNHSSLGAGGDVICAGEMDFQNGKITEINNFSGHYAPDMQRFHDAIACLVDEYEADLTGCLLKIMDPVTGNAQRVQNGMDFYNNVNCPKT